MPHDDVAGDLTAYVRSFYLPTPPVDQEALQEELPPTHAELELRFRGDELVSVRPVSWSEFRARAQFGSHGATRLRSCGQRPRQGRAPRSRRRVTRSRAGPARLDDDPDLDDEGPLTAHELDEVLELHDRLVVIAGELDALDADLADVPLTLLRGLIEELEDMLG